MINPHTIVHERMYPKDAFSQWLGIKVEDISEGFCKVSMLVREEMVNGFGIAHGGITYSLADSAFAFASNSFGRMAVSIDTGISHTARVIAGDRLTATANVQYKGNKTGVYEVTVVNQDNRTVALFKGTVFHLEKEWQ